MKRLDRATLHQAALGHLARFSTTQAGLIRVLDRRIGRWAKADGIPEPEIDAARVAAREVVSALASAGAVDDAAFAAARAVRLARSGRSRRAVSAHLAAKGIGAATVEQVLPPPGQELAAALAYARRRRLGPFRAGDPADDADDRARRLKELGALARAGFPQEIAMQALRTPPDEAEALVAALRRA